MQLIKNSVESYLFFFFKEKKMSADNDNDSQVSSANQDEILEISATLLKELAVATYLIWEEVGNTSIKSLEDYMCIYQTRSDAFFTISGIVIGLTTMRFSIEIAPTTFFATAAIGLLAIRTIANTIFLETNVKPLDEKCRILAQLATLCSNYQQQRDAALANYDLASLQEVNTSFRNQFTVLKATYPKQNFTVQTTMTMKFVSKIPLTMVFGQKLLSFF